MQQSRFLHNGKNRLLIKSDAHACALFVVLSQSTALISGNGSFGLNLLFAFRPAFVTVSIRTKLANRVTAITALSGTAPFLQMALWRPTPQARVPLFSGMWEYRDMLCVLIIAIGSQKCKHMFGLTAKKLPYPTTGFPAVKAVICVEISIEQ